MVNLNPYIYTVMTFNFCTSQADVCHCLVVQTPMDDISKNKQSIAITHSACKSKLRIVGRSFMHPCPGNQVAIGSAFVHYAQAAHAFSAGIKCRHCIAPSMDQSIYTHMILSIHIQWLTSSTVLHSTHMVTLTDLFTPAPQHRARC